MRTEPMRWVKYDPDDPATHPRDGKWAVVVAAVDRWGDWRPYIRQNLTERGVTGADVPDPNQPDAAEWWWLDCDPPGLQWWVWIRKLDGPLDRHGLGTIAAFKTAEEAERHAIRATRENPGWLAWSQRRR